MNADFFGVRPVDGINLLILAMLIWILIRIINDAGNLVVWADFVSTKGIDGKQHGDLNKIGQIAGIVLAVVTVLMYADNTTVDPTGLAALLTVALIYLGGVTAFAVWMRSKQKK